MPRTKTLPDQDVLETAFALMQKDGPDALTFSALAETCGLSGSTLVQRFKSKPQLIQAALLQAWDKLDRRTAELAAALPKTPGGAIELLVGLSADYGAIDSYADGLLILREDLRDPALRARGAAWGTALSQAIEDCFVSVPEPPGGIGRLMASQWQGALLWWSFNPRGCVENHVRESLTLFVSAIARIEPSNLAIR